MDILNSGEFSNLSLNNVSVFLSLPCSHVRLTHMLYTPTREDTWICWHYDCRLLCSLWLLWHKGFCGTNTDLYQTWINGPSDSFTATRVMNFINAASVFKATQWTVAYILKSSSMRMLIFLIANWINLFYLLTISRKGCQQSCCSKKVYHILHLKML